MKPPAPATIQRYKAVISYDGTEYCGYQIQTGLKTVQEELERAIQQVTGTPLRVFCSGRTDQGVHARGQVVHFDRPLRREPSKLMRSLNAVLPPDIRVEELQCVPARFDARMDASSKEYRYLIWNQQALSPDIRKYRLHVWNPLDVAAMAEAARRLEGRHDFAAFSANPRREVGGTVRTLWTLKVSRQGPQITIRAVGQGFLYKMVRSLAGFLIDVGQGIHQPEDADRILQSKRRTGDVRTAEPHGLFLWKVNYGRKKAPRTEQDSD